jgi:hypothetical protein
MVAANMSWRSNGFDSLPRAETLASTLLQEVEKLKLADQLIHVFDEDILDSYFRRSTKPGTKPSTKPSTKSRREAPTQVDLFQENPVQKPVTETPELPPSPRVQLYWGAIGLLARLLGASTATLTVVALTHELAHGYTHLGLDIDDQGWSTETFQQSSRILREALAQYYTAKTLTYLENRLPDGLSCFQKLLACQPPEYRIHETWLQEAQSEAVRNTLVQLRRGDPIKLGKFEETLIAETTRLSRKPPVGWKPRSERDFTSASFPLLLHKGSPSA